MDVHKIRQSNIELCRIASILLVMLVHTVGRLFDAEVSFGVDLLKAFSIIGVNVFILITGYFSATPKKTSLLNLAFICFFWMIIKVAVRNCLGEDVGYKDYFFITSSNWFIASYIGLLFLAPVLNSFCNSASKKTLWMGGAFLVLIEVWFDLLPPYPKILLGTQYGYSVFSFMIIYLLARAIRLYGLPKVFKILSPFIYVGCSFALGVFAFFCQKTGHGDALKIVFAYSNPVVIISSISFFIMFERMSFHSDIINHISKSTLACLLGHTSIVFFYTKQFKYLYDHYSGYEVAGFWTMAIVIVFLTSIIIDQLRLLFWKPLNAWLITHIKNNNLF